VLTRRLSANLGTVSAIHSREEAKALSDWHRKSWGNGRHSSIPFSYSPCDSPLGSRPWMSRTSSRNSGKGPKKEWERRKEGHTSQQELRQSSLQSAGDFVLFRFNSLYFTLSKLSITSTEKKSTLDVVHQLILRFPLHTHFLGHFTQIADR